tara:strand:+ start:249 stop:497 length:249 start_codon:yes stop_codon:yes gene_type:complete
MKHFTIICLKRSCFKDKGDFEYTSEWWNECELVYWLPNRCGYTTDEDDAGIYSLEDLDECAGDGWDWIARPLTRHQLEGLTE